MFTKPSTDINYNEQQHPQWEAQAKNDFVNNQTLHSSSMMSMCEGVK
jgi:hypothetical protein